MNRASLLVVVLLTVALSLLAEAQDRQEYMGARFVTGALGVSVAAVAPGSPAAKAGLRSGDSVQTLDGQPVDDAVDLCDALKARPAGAPPRLTVRREGQIVTITLGPGDSKPGPAASRPTTRPAVPRSAAAPSTRTSAPLTGAAGHPARVARKPAGPHRAHGGFRTIQQSGGIHMQIHRYGDGYAFAPADWLISGSPQGNSLSLHAPDFAAAAGWIMLAVPRVRQPYYGDVYGDPNTSMHALLTLQLRALTDTSEVRWTGPDRKSVV